MAGFSDSYALDCFSESYVEARAKFRAAAESANAELYAFEVCRDASDIYYQDVAVLRGEGKGVVVVTSGTHGVEGYAGSAIQISLLKELSPSSRKTTVVLVHAVNPFGMAHFRRWNENNVDLNRNALLPHHLDQLVREDRMQATYMKFDPLFNPTSPPGCCYTKIGIWFDMGINILRHGLKNLKMALVAATYSQSKGVFYGGQELQKSHVLLKNFIATNFAETRASDVVWIDIHTGLGPKGIDVLLGGGSPGEQDLAQLFPKVAGVTDGFQALSEGMTTDEKIEQRCSEAVPMAAAGGPVNQSAGYEMTVGVLSTSSWLSQFFKPDSGTVCTVTQEFGTCSNLLVARALVLENAGFNWDRKNHSYWRSFTRDAFYVRTVKWKQQVLARGHDVYNKFVSRLEKSIEKAS